MQFKTITHAVSLAAISLTLAACNGGGVGSTPKPGGGGTPTPSPSATPTPTGTPTPSPTPTGGAGGGDSPAAALGYTSDTTFEAATAEFAVRPPSTIYGEQDAEAFGQGTKIEYKAASDSYKFTRSDNVTITVTPADIDRDGQLNGEGGLFGGSGGTIYVVEDGNKTHTVAMVGPDDFQLSYMAISLWNILDKSGTVPTNELQWQLWGKETATLPTGSAKYSLDKTIGANGFAPNEGIVGAAYDFLNGQSTGELSVNFGSGNIDVLLHLIGYDYVAKASKDFGNFEGGGQISSGARYGGTFDKGGEFYGAFFGPAAEETGFTFFINSSNLKVTGVAAGLKD
jgi:hypothetical protein